MRERDEGSEPLEDQGVLEPADSLEEDDLRADPRDTGIAAGDRYAGANRFGNTADEERRGESLDELLPEEEPDAGPDSPWTDEEQPSDDGTAAPRAGRLVAPDGAAHGDDDSEAFAYDVGIDGGGAGAEEAAVHLIEE